MTAPEAGGARASSGAGLATDPAGGGAAGPEAVAGDPAVERVGDGVDPFLHTPARLGVMSLLAPAEWVEFGYLREALGTSDSALSKQLAALQDAGYLEIRKERGPTRRTLVRMSPDGRTAFDRYLDALERIVARARSPR